MAWYRYPGLLVAPWNPSSAWFNNTISKAGKKMRIVGNMIMNT